MKYAIIGLCFLKFFSICKLLSHKEECMPTLRVRIILNVFIPFLLSSLINLSFIWRYETIILTISHSLAYLIVITMILICIEILWQLKQLLILSRLSSSLNPFSNFLACKCPHHHDQMLPIVIAISNNPDIHIPSPIIMCNRGSHSRKKNITFIFESSWLPSTQHI